MSDTQAVSADFHLYRTDYERSYTETGRSASNTIWSLAGEYSLDAHTLTLAYQRSSGGFGQTGYDYGLDGGGTVWLANSSQLSDFIAKDERSWLVGYNLDMTALGVPGLNLGARYVQGRNIDMGAGQARAREREFDVAASYRLQRGAAKDLTLHLQQAFYRADSAFSDDFNEIRLIAEYPLSIL